MTMTRREFAGTSLAAAGATALPALEATACTGETRPSPDSEGAVAERAARPGRLLILGGTGFIGPHMVRHALERGHEITLFNRGRTNPGLFPGVETLIGDRDGALDALRGKEWDYVIDNSGYVPRLVRDSATSCAMPSAAICSPPPAPCTTSIRMNCRKMPDSSRWPTPRARMWGGTTGRSR
ncbi:NAD-dependent epimerase/dehydratase family protein [Candidatus Palauibacter sp.]|uniref:NAD-dependent epimerase/dehydratase family protein n=1 Tax=Candidatus Palauibacter sp. TaxID=3101350 RepID=UPI003C7026B5